MEQPLQIAVIGAGRAGRLFALRCLAAGQSVVLEDVLPEKLRGAQEQLDALPAGVGYGRLALASSVEDAVREADVVVDFVPDELESKLEIFSLIDRMAPPRTVLITPTETLSIADLASCTYRADRCFGLRGMPSATTDVAEGHPVSVTLLYPECAAGSARTRVEGLLRSLGFTVCAVRDEMPSMLAGRG